MKSIVQFEQGTMDRVQEFKFCVALIVQKYCWLWAICQQEVMHVNACQRFRLEQTEALEALITGKKVLTILLTGFGKNPIC